jgi:hypothetical protein
VLDNASERYEKAQAEIQAQRDALDRKFDTENRRWNQERQRLKAELKKL